MGWFSLAAGLLTGWLAIDDLFMMHEIVLPAFGVPQGVVVGSIAVLALAYVVASWRIILTSDYWILLAGGIALVASIMIDQVYHSPLPALVYAEDGAKFFGIFCWGTYHIITVFYHVLRSVDQRTSGADS